MASEEGGRRGRRLSAARVTAAMAPVGPAGPGQGGRWVAEWRGQAKRGRVLGTLSQVSGSQGHLELPREHRRNQESTVGPWAQGAVGSNDRA